MTRLAKALNSSDLAHEEQDCDVDLLQAAATTAMPKLTDEEREQAKRGEFLAVTADADRTRSLGVLIVEAKEGAAGEGAHAVARIKDLEDALGPRIKRLARRWNIKVDAGRVSALVAKELILDRCTVCQGRGVIPMKYDGQRMVAIADDLDAAAHDVDCHVCFGSGAGRRDHHARAKSAGFSEYSSRLSDWWEALLNSCADAELSARVAMWRRLKASH